MDMILGWLLVGAACAVLGLAVVYRSDGKIMVGDAFTAVVIVSAGPLSLVYLLLAVMLRDKLTYVLYERNDDAEHDT